MFCAISHEICATNYKTKKHEKGSLPNDSISGTINAENTSVELGNLSAGIYLFSEGENVKQSIKVIKE